MAELYCEVPIGPDPSCRRQVHRLENPQPLGPSRSLPSFNSFSLAEGFGEGVGAMHASGAPQGIRT